VELVRGADAQHDRNVLLLLSKDALIALALA